jgi:site-specific DNA-methyltransferase (adenine-specific)
MSKNTNWQIIEGKCLKKLSDFADNSADMCFSDLPYASTNQDWDEIIPVNLMWNELKRVVKKDGAILLFQKDLEMVDLINSQRDAYKFRYIWKKNRVTNPHNVYIMPLRNYEEIAVFCFGKLPYYPQKSTGHKPTNSATKKADSTKVYRQSKETYSPGGDTERFPKLILEFDCVNNDSKERIHANQKPVPLLTHLIRQHSKEGETVLDICSGSGSAGIAAIIENRKFVGIEKDENYAKLSTQWLSKVSGGNYEVSLADYSKKPLFENAQAF